MLNTDTWYLSYSVQSFSLVAGQMGETECPVFCTVTGSTPSPRTEPKDPGPTYTTVSFLKNPDSPTDAAVTVSKEEPTTEYASIKHHT